MPTRLDQLFPTVTSEQLARISEHGTRRELRSGEVVYEAGAEEVPFVVVVAGQLQTVRPSEAGDTVITALGPGQFTGEANMLSGHRPLVRVLATKASQVVELTRAQLLDVVQTDVELGEILMHVVSSRRSSSSNAHTLARAGRLSSRSSETVFKMSSRRFARVSTMDSNGGRVIPICPL
jgi:thioredoxin reductase (NADPH)